jgi:hypothetical protein
MIFRYILVTASSSKRAAWRGEKITPTDPMPMGVALEKSRFKRVNPMFTPPLHLCKPNAKKSPH